MWDWQAFFVQIGIPATVASRYAEIFRQNRVSKDMLPDLDKSTLADLGVTAVGDQLAILRKGRDASFDMGTDSTAKLRVHITGPGEGTETLSNGSAATGELRKGLVVRGTTGVRQGGRSVSPVDKRSPAVIRMRQEREEARLVDPVITRLGVRGLHSDGASRVISGRVQKRSVQTSENLRLPRSTDDIAIRVRIPSSSEVEERIFRKPKSRMTSSIVNRISRNRGSGFPHVAVKSHNMSTDNRTVITSVRKSRKPIHSRLAKVASGRRLTGSTRVAARPMTSPDYLVEDDLSAEDEEFVDDEMIWDEEDDEFDVVEYVEDTRPSVYNRLSR